MPRPACRCCRSSPARRRRGSQILLYTLPMAAAAVAPWPLGLAGAALRHRRGRAQPRLPGAGARRAARSRASEPAEMKPEKRLFAFSILYLFALFGALVARPLAAAHDPDRAGQEIRRRQKSRAIDHGGAARRLRRPGLRDHHRQDGPGSDDSRNARTALLAGLLVCGDDRPRLRQRAALPAVLPGHRLRRHDPARRGGPGAGRSRPA